MYSLAIARTIKVLERALLEAQSIEAQITTMPPTDENKARVAATMHGIIEPVTGRLIHQTLGYRSRAKGITV